MTQLSLTIPFGYFTKKTVGSKKIGGAISSWIPAAMLYALWNTYNTMVIHYSQIFAGIMSETSAYSLRAVWGLILMLGVLPMFYEGKLLERYFFFSFFEIISLISETFRFLYMMLFKNSGLYHALEQRLIWLLIFRVFIECAPFFFCYYVFSVYFDNYKVFVKKYRKICIAATILGIALESTAGFLSVQGVYMEIWRGVLGTFYLSLSIIAVIVMLRNANKRKHLQKELLENHYRSLRSQEGQIINMQDKIGKLLAEAEKLEKEKGYGEEELKYYGEELKSLHSQLRRVDYCDNLMLDAVLHNKERKCEEKQIKLDIKMQDISFGEVPDVDIFEIVYGMLGAAIEETETQKESFKTIGLSGKNLAGQAVMEASFPSNTNRNQNHSNESMKQYKRLKRKVKSLNEQCIWKTEGEREKIVVGFRCFETE